MHPNCKCQDEAIEELRKDGYDVDQIDLIYHQIKEYIETGNFRSCDYYLSSREPSKLQDEFIIAILFATQPAKSWLDNRITFYQKSLEHLIKKYSEAEAKDLLSGLD